MSAAQTQTRGYKESMGVSLFAAAVRGGSGVYLLMFVCPDCGFRLPACWKAHKHFLYAYYCRLDEFEQFYPAAFVELLKEKREKMRKW